MIAEYALDSDAMSILLSPDRFDIQRIAGVLERTDARLIIVDLAIGECGRGDPERAYDRLANLRALWDALPDHRIGHAVRLPKLFKMEVRGDRFAGTPVHARGIHDPIAHKDREAWIADHGRFCTTVDSALTRQRMRETDLRVERETEPARRRDMAESLPALLAELPSVFAEDKWPLCVLVPDAPGGDPHAHRRALVRDVRYARAHAMFCGLAFLNATGAVTKHEPRGAHARTVSSEPGNWDDACIAATAAYCRGIVTHDGRFTERLRAVRKSGLSLVEPLRLEDVGL